MTHRIQARIFLVTLFLVVPEIALATAPGGVTTDLGMWLRADQGVTDSSNTVTGWTDQVGNQSLTINGNPQTGLNTLNNNNVIEFDGTGDYIDGNATTDMRHAFIVLDNTSGSGVALGPAEEVAASTRGYFFRDINDSGTNKIFIGDLDPTYLKTSSASPDGYLLLHSEMKGGSTATDSRIAVDGADQSVALHSGSGGVAQHTSTPRIARGSDSNPGSESYFTGNIAEIIIYGGSGLSAANINRIESYLAIKYGITLDSGEDYVSASSTVIYDSNGTHSSYTNDIAGIGQDDDSGLDQATSTSINSDVIVTIGSASSQDNKDFLVWGNDNGATSTQTSDIPSGIEERLTREWRVDETGTIGTITIEFVVSDTSLPQTGNGSEYILLIDSDGTFSNATQHTTGANWDSGVVRFTDVDFSDGDYFSLGISDSGSTALGGVFEDLALWLDAGDPDADGESSNNPSDTATVATWHDKSGNDNDATTHSGQNDPNYSSSAGELINSEPVMRFNRSSQTVGDVYQVADVDIRADTNEDVTIFTVYRPKTDSLPGSQHHGVWGADDGSWDRFFASNHASFGDGTNDGLASLGPVSQGAVVADAGEVNTVRLLAAVYDGAVSGGVNSGPVNGSEIYFNGEIITRFTDETDDLSAQTEFYVGWDGDDGPFDGDIAEVILYYRILSCEEFNNVTEYLGNKYGQTFTTVSPGGVSCSLKAWLRADEGTNTTTDGADVTTWTDQSGFGNDAVDTGLTAPDYSASSINSNPSISFNETSEGLTIVDNNDFNTNASGYTTKSFALTFKTSTDITSRQTIYEQGGTTNGLNVYIRNSSLYANLWENDNNNYDSTSISANSVYTLTFIFDGTNTRWDGYLNGTSSLSDTSATGTLPSHSGDIGIGQTKDSSRFDDGTTSGEGDYFEGDVAELDYYNIVLTTTEREIIESYNGIKYGITIDHNYIQSDGTIVWNMSSNSTYHNDVAGIGQDDTSNLDQTQSRSENSDAIITVSTASSQDDDDFLIWGNNNGTTSEVAENMPDGVTKRLGRIWKFDETGDIGTTTITFDLTGLSISGAVASDFLLITDTDTTFTSGAATTSAVSYATSTNIVTFTGVDIVDNSFVTLGTDVLTVAPGGISDNLTLWLKADAGVTESSGAVTDWADQTTNGYDFTQGTSANRPASTSNAMNYNSAITFDGSNDFLEDADGESYIEGNSAISTFVAVDADTAAFDGYIFTTSIDADLTEAPWSLRFDDSGAESSRNDTLKTGINAAGTDELYEADDDNLTKSTPLVAGVSWNSGSNPIFYVEGRSVSSYTSPTQSGTLNDADFVRIGDDGNQDFWDGHVGEVIIYDTVLSSADRNKVESYLALKYGTTLDQSTAQDYTASDGTEMWDKDASEASTYDNDIAGIGRDDTSGLGQVKSGSSNSDGIVIVSVDGEGTNEVPSFNDIDDLEFMTWGNDNGTTSQVTTNLPAGVSKRLGRIWKIQETSETGTTTVQFDLSGLAVDGSTTTDFILITDTDTTFTSGATKTTASDYASTTNLVTFNDINFSNADYFALGTFTGTLNVTIVDASSTTVASPSVNFNDAGFSFSDQTATGTLGTPTEKIRVNNGTANAAWSLSIAAASTTALWIATSSTYDFNDPTANAEDGGDTDTVGGELTIDPSSATLTPDGGCTSTGVSFGSSASFSEGVVDSITIVSANGSADTACTWDITDISLSQTIPKEQPAESYRVNLTLSVIAS